MDSKNVITRVMLTYLLHLISDLSILLILVQGFNQVVYPTIGSLVIGGSKSLTTTIDHMDIF